MFPINSNEDLVTALSENQEFRDSVRRIILTDDLLDLPARFDKHADETANAIRELTGRTADNTRAIASLTSQTAENTRAIASLTSQMAENTRAIASLTSQTAENTRAIAELVAQTAASRQSIEELTSQVSRIGGQVSNLTGATFEQRNRERVRRIVRDLLGMRETRLVPDVPRLIEEAWVTGRINTDEAGEIESSDVVVQGITGPDDHTVYVIGEISVTIQNHDVERARRRANLLARATGSQAIPAVAGINVPPDTDESDGLTVIRLPTEAGQNP